MRSHGCYGSVNHGRAIFTGGYVSKRGNQVLSSNVLPSRDETLVTETSSQVNNLSACEVRGCTGGAVLVGLYCTSVGGDFHPHPPRRVEA